MTEEAKNPSWWNSFSSFDLPSSSLEAAFPLLVLVDCSRQSRSGRGLRIHHRWKKHGGRTVAATSTSASGNTWKRSDDYGSTMRSHSAAEQLVYQGGRVCTAYPYPYNCRTGHLPLLSWPPLAAVEMHAILDVGRPATSAEIGTVN